MRFTIYYSSKDKFLEPLHKLAKDSDRTVGYMIRKILNEYFNNNKGYVGDLSNIRLATKKELAIINKPKRQKKIKKVDPATFEAEMTGKIIGSDTRAENCSKRIIDNEGNPTCYHFDNFREYYPFCVKDCWGNKDIWGNKARKLKPMEEEK